MSSAQDGVRAPVRDLIERYLVSKGMHTNTGTKGHEVVNPTRKVIRVICPICGTKNRSTRVRCRKCDAFIVVAKPTGTDKQQKEYLKHYAENYDAIEKQQKAREPK